MSVLHFDGFGVNQIVLGMRADDKTSLTEKISEARPDMLAVALAETLASAQARKREGPTV